MGDNGIRTHRKKSMSFSKSSVAAHKGISAIYLIVFKIYLHRFMRLNIDQITVYQSLFINKANVNRGSRNGITCSMLIAAVALNPKVYESESYANLQPVKLLNYLRS